MAKDLKSSMELAVTVMNKVRERAELSDLKGLQIRRVERHQPEASNWEAIFEMVGYDSNGRPAPMMTPHPLAYEIVKDIQSRFDLA
jgi:hypothetical protein